MTSPLDRDPERSERVASRLDARHYGDPEGERPPHVAPPESSGTDPTLVLVGCGASKRDETAPARDLYTSTYFSKKRQYAESVGDRWAILSAEHGLLLPLDAVEPYDTTMADVDPGVWAGEVIASIYDLMDRVWHDRGQVIEEIEILAGQDYIDPLRPTLTDGRPWDVRLPFEETSGIGEQMQLLSARVEGVDQS